MTVQHTCGDGLDIGRTGTVHFGETCRCGGTTFAGGGSGIDLNRFAGGCASSFSGFSGVHVINPLPSAEKGSAIESAQMHATRIAQSCKNLI